jgi:hypothetical protein
MHHHQQAEAQKTSHSRAGMDGIDLKRKYWQIW